MKFSTQHKWGMEWKKRRQDFPTALLSLVARWAQKLVLNQSSAGGCRRQVQSVSPSSKEISSFTAQKQVALEGANTISNCCQMCSFSGSFRILAVGPHPTGGSAVMIKQSLHSAKLDRQEAFWCSRGRLSQTAALRISFVFFAFLAFYLDHQNGGPWSFSQVPCCENRLELHSNISLIQIKRL